MALLASTFVLSDALLAAGLDFLQSPKARMVTWAVGIFLVLGIAWGAYMLADSVNRKKCVQKTTPTKKKKPGDVFDEICTAHGLASDQKRHLLAGAAELKLDSPALLFVDSALLHNLAASEHKDASEFRQLADRLFPLESESTASGDAESEQAELSAATTTA